MPESTETQYKGEDLSQNAHKQCQKHPITIIVNGREKLFFDRKISFTEIIELAFGCVPSNENTCYTVTYKKGEDKKREGTLVEGDCVKVKCGMIFNVTATDKS